jgi:hypothetical protein
MRNGQRGITMLGLLILVTFLGLFVYAGIRLVPVYLEYMNIAKTLESLKSETGGAASPTVIRNILGKRFDSSYITSIEPKDVDITKDGDFFLVRATYDAVAPFVGNVDFVVHFDKSVSVPVGGAH